MNPRRFRVAFSFAGEKREFVAKVARLLAARFGESAILYDKFHESEFARCDLGIYLPKLYGEQSDLIVPILCPAYDAKRWTGWEWMHIYGLLTKADSFRVMPCRFDYASADGLSAAAGFVELDDKTPEQVSMLILERLALNEGQPKDRYVRPAAPLSDDIETVIPHNLPRLQPFFGREDELRKIASALDPDDRTWGALIDGPGGMGKTALAIRAAYDASPKDFKRITFISLKSRELDDDGVRDLSGFLIAGLAELFNELARELGHPGIAKASVDERPRLLIEALRGTQTLLVLDNLESLTKLERDRVFTFVKKLPQGCKAILTSRGRIGSGAEELILEKLDQTAALATLAELATHNPLLASTSDMERIALYAQTAGKPLLLRWTAGQLGRGHCLSLTDAIAFLRSCPPGNDPLEFIFGDLVVDFSANETNVLCALTYFTLPARVEHICGLTNPLSRDERFRVLVESDFEIGDIDEEGKEAIQSLTDSEVRTTLRSLINRSIVVPSEELQMFALVPLVADFLRKTRPEAVSETGDRLEKRAYALMVENGYKNYERFQVLDAAWPTVAAALPRFLTGSFQKLKTLCEALELFFEWSGHWDEWLALSEHAEREGVRAGDLLFAGEQAHTAGHIYHLREESAAVLECGKRALSHWNSIAAPKDKIADANHLIGHGHKIAKEYPAAISAFKAALEINTLEWPSNAGMITDLCCMARTEMASGDLSASEGHLDEALERAALLSSPHMASVLDCRADLALERKEWAKAEALCREALIKFEEVQYPLGIASACQSLAKALVRQDRRAEAVPYAQRAVNYYARLGSLNLADARATLDECQNSAHVST